MEWTLGRPDAPGWWIRASATGNNITKYHVLEVKNNKELAGIGKGLYLGWSNSAELKRVELLQEWWWFGPIPSPAPVLEITL